MAQHGNEADDELKLVYRELRALMWTIAKQSRQAVEQQVQSEGIEMSWLQQGVLRVLHHEGEQTISELSKKFMCDPSTLVPSVDALERKQLVNRQRDPQDRRRVILSLTGGAQHLIQRMDAVRDDDPLLTSLRQMGSESTAQLLALMRQLIEGTPDGAATVQHLQERIRMDCAGSATSSQPASQPASNIEGDN